MKNNDSHQTIVINKTARLFCFIYVIITPRREIFPIGILISVVLPIII